MRPTVVTPRCRPARERTWAILTLPIAGQTVFRSADHLGHEVRKLVHRLAGLDQGMRPVLFQTADPRGDGRRGDEELPRRLRQRPSPRRSQFQDGHPLDRRVIRPGAWAIEGHSRILDADLLGKHSDFRLEPVVLRRQPHPRACCFPPPNRGYRPWRTAPARSPRARPTARSGSNSWEAELPQVWSLRDHEGYPEGDANGNNSQSGNHDAQAPY